MAGRAALRAGRRATQSLPGYTAHPHYSGNAPGCPSASAPVLCPPPRPYLGQQFHRPEPSSRPDSRPRTSIRRFTYGRGYRNSHDVCAPLLDYSVFVRQRGSNRPPPAAAPGTPIRRFFHAGTAHGHVDIQAATLVRRRQTARCRYCSGQRARLPGLPRAPVRNSGGPGPAVGAALPASSLNTPGMLCPRSRNDRPGPIAPGRSRACVIPGHCRGGWRQIQDLA
jgi:hypothetical protein